MRSLVQRYPATTIAAVVVLIGGGIAAALLLGNDDAASGRFATLIGIISIAVTTLLSVQRTEQGNEKIVETQETINAAVADGQPQSTAAMEALRVLVEATNRAKSTADTLEKVANGHASGEMQTREGDNP